jgi:lysophospholipase L1-like esterase
VTTKEALDIVPDIIRATVPTAAMRRAAGLPVGGLLVLGLGFALSGSAAAQQPGGSASPPAVDLAARFAQRVEAYEAGDKLSPPPANAILLAGDSQFDRWKTLQEDLPGYTIINRGIDSFRTDDLIQYADRLIVRYKPRMVILHVGGNDISRGKSPEQLLADTRTLIAKIRAGLPGVPIAWSSTTPGPARWAQAPQRKAANALVQQWIATQQGLTFIDLWDAMLTADGQPREDIWVADRVHPNHEGYLIRVRLTTPVLGPPDRKK